MTFRSPLAAPELIQLAERQLADYRRGSPGSVFAGDVELSLDDAYAVQRLVARLRVADGEAPAGYTIGMPGPVSGHLWRDELRRNGSWVSATRFRNLAVEAEVAAMLDDAGAVAALFPVVELLDDTLRGTPPALPEVVAGNALHAGVVLPADPTTAPAVLPAGARLELEIDGEVVESGPPFAFDGGAQVSLDWLRGHLTGLGAALPGRSLVLLGSPLRRVAVAAGAQVAARVAGMRTQVSITG